MSLEDLDAARKRLPLHASVQNIGENFDAFAMAAHNAIWQHSRIEVSGQPSSIDRFTVLGPRDAAAVHQSDGLGAPASAQARP